MTGLGLPTRKFCSWHNLTILWFLRTDCCKSRRMGFHHLEGLEKMLPDIRIIAVFGMVWSVGRGIARDCGGIANEKNRREQAVRDDKKSCCGCPMALSRPRNGLSSRQKVWKTAACGDELRPEQGFYGDRRECPRSQRAPVAAPQPAAVALGFGKG